MRGIVLIAVMAMSSFTWANVIDLPPDADFKAYQRLYRQLRQQHPERFQLMDNNPQVLPTDPLERAIALGARSQAWIDTLNKSRPKDKQLITSKVAKKGGIPPEEPSKYSPSTIAADLAKWESSAPQEFLDVLVTQAKPYTTEFTIDETEFLKLNRKIQGIYSISIRWKSFEPWIPYLRERKAEDIRGYIFLSRETNLENDLENFASLDSDKQGLWRGYFLQLCLNNEIKDKDCRQIIMQAIQSGKIKEKVLSWMPAAKKLWDESFSVQWRGTDIAWVDAEKSVLNAGIRATGNAALEASFHDILARVWHVGESVLEAYFAPQAALQIIFEPAAQAHYDQRQGAIVMDQNGDMQDPENEIVLAHEFGHALGFPDCYVEFYDDDEQAIINYQLDIQNIMCSLNGTVNAGHFEELRKVY
jgi:hypothetical protein